MKFMEGRTVKKLHVEKNGKRMQVIFRYPKKGDAKDMLRYINSLVEEKALIGKTTKATLREERAYVKELCGKARKKQLVHLVAEAGGRIVSMVHVIPDSHDAGKHTAHIGISVIGQFRKLGIAEAITSAALRLAEKHLKTEIAYLVVFDSNKPALRLYKKLGFEQFGLLPDGVRFHGRYLDSIFMYKVLK